MIVTGMDIIRQARRVPDNKAVLPRTNNPIPASSPASPVNACQHRPLLLRKRTPNAMPAANPIVLKIRASTAPSLGFFSVNQIEKDVMTSTAAIRYNLPDRESWLPRITLKAIPQTIIRDINQRLVVVNQKDFLGSIVLSGILFISGIK
jgi:hypothetical protein